VTSPSRRPGSTWADALSLTIGTFTVIPVRPPTHVDRKAAARSLVLGVVLGVFIGAAMWAIALLAQRAWGSDFIAALAVITFSTALTRALHLDGLADTVDALGSRRQGEAGLDVMKRSDVGPFGVISLVLALLVQVGSIALLVHADLAWTLVLVLPASRAAALIACQRRIPPARANGLGAAVASSVGAVTWWCTAALLLLTSAGTAGVQGVNTSDAARLAIALILGWLAAWAVVRRCVARFGGITGDVIGACIELSLTVALVVAAATGI
jgi:adenosylcobinamide-GDP ribazoletransferase